MTKKPGLLHLAFRVASVSLFLFVLGCGSGTEKTRTTLKYGYPVCYSDESFGSLIATKQDLERFVANYVRDDLHQKTGFCVRIGDSGDGLRFSVIENDGYAVKIKVRFPAKSAYAWVYRPSVYDESPEQFIALVRSFLKTGKASKEAFIHPETGQLEECLAGRPSLGPRPRDKKKLQFYEFDLACDKQVRAKGFIRADEYQSQFFKP